MVLAAGARARLSMAHAEVPETFRREGAVQGGALASLIDEAAGVALLSSQQPGEPPRVVTVTTDLNVSYLDAARTDLLAQARVLRVGGRWCSSRCTCGMQTKRSLRRARDDGREPRGIMRPAQSDGDGSPRDEAVREAGESGGGVQRTTRWTAPALTSEVPRMVGSFVRKSAAKAKTATLPAARASRNAVGRDEYHHRVAGGSASRGRDR